jgi:hypothetical protein
VSAQRLDKQYHIPKERWANLPHEEGGLYAIKDLQSLVTEIYGDASFDAYDMRIKREEREEGIRIRAEMLKRWTEQAGIAPESFGMSQTMMHNSMLPYRLTRASFWPLLKKIKTEVRRGERREASPPQKCACLACPFCPEDKNKTYDKKQLKSHLANRHKTWLPDRFFEEWN